MKDQIKKFKAQIAQNLAEGRKIVDAAGAEKRGLSADAVIPEATTVPAAVVEIARLQSEEKAAYIKIKS